MKETVVETNIDRKITVTTSGPGCMVDFDVMDTAKHPDAAERVYSLLEPEEAKTIGLALLGENATVVTDLPEVEVSENGLYARAGDVQRRIEYYTAEDFLTSAKQYLALHAFMVKHDAEQEAVKAAEAEKEAARGKRRDELAEELTGYAAKYQFATEMSQKAIDRIIDLEEAAQVS